MRLFRSLARTISKTATALVLLLVAGVAAGASGDEGCTELLVERPVVAGLGAAKASVGAAEAQFVRDDELVSVISLAGDYGRFLEGTAVNTDPRMAVAQEFFGEHPDEYDFLVVFTSFDFDLAGARAVYWGLKNDTLGLGQPEFDNSDLFGSAGRLQGYIDMSALSETVLEPSDPRFEEVLAALGHEILHRWGARVRFRESNGSLSSALLGRDGSHWNALLDSQASLLYGADWRDNSNGTFTAAATLKFWSPLDLYLAGFYRPDEVPPFSLLTSAEVDPGQLPLVGQTISATARTIAVDDIVAAEGPRFPAAEEAQKEFRLAFLLVTRPGEAVDSRAIAGINRLRREMATRFSVLTGGRALLHPYPQAVPIGTPGSPGGVGGGPLRPGEADLPAAFTWLRGRQGADGSWADHPTTRPRDTAVALAALARLDSAFGGTAPAVGWLAGQGRGNTDFLARSTTVLASLGENVALLRNQLLPAQNVDGGWGVATGFASDPLDTALALSALAGSQLTGTAAAVDRAVAYLAARQNPDGGFGNSAGSAGRTSVTAAVVRALFAHGRTEGMVPAALTWFAGRQNGDGGFGDSPSTVHDTALVLDTLLTVGSSGGASLGQAAAYLRTRQATNGSFEGSVYATSLAATSLARFTFANLRATAPPTASPASPLEGELVLVSFTVGNDGNVTAPASELAVYLGDPVAGGTLVAPAVSVPAIPAGQAVTVTVSWDSTETTGTVSFVAVIDAAGVVDELSEQDNHSTLDLTVAASPAGPELTIQDTDLLIDPASPTELPVTLGISALIRNVGRTDAPGVVVRLLAGPPGVVGELVLEQTLSFAARSSAVVSFSYLLASGGATELTVLVDPDGAVAEENEANNRASRIVSTVASVDLVVKSADLELLGSPYLGNDVSFRSRLGNRGTQESPDFSARYTVTDGVATRTLATNQVRLPGGASTVQEIPWRVDLAGPLAFEVALDPLSLVPESDESNNVATLDFTAGALDQPNLAVSFADFTFDPNPGREGKALHFDLLVRNNGGVAAENVAVAFFDGDPAAGALRLGDAPVIGEILPGAAALARFTWPRVPTDADRLFYAIVDPDNTLAEFREDDNAAFNVLPVLSLPDLAISSTSLELAPRFPRPGEPVTLTVTVANLGQQEAANVVVRAYDGDPAAGAQQVAPEQVIPLVGGNGSGVAVFSFTLAAGGGSRPLVVLVDPDNTHEESVEVNNRASLEVAIEEGDTFVSNRYFSPNGDGVLDDTELFFRLAAPAAVAVEVVDEVRGIRVRRSELGTVESPVEAGRFAWNGTDGEGRIGRDADYLLRVVDASGAVLAAARATLDTNRISLLQVAGTGLEAHTNLTCDLPVPDGFQVTRTDDWAYFYLSDTSGSFTHGVYRMSLDGAEVEQILPSAFFGIFRPLNLVISPDGGKIAVLKHRFTSGPITELWVASGDGSGRQRLSSRPDGTTIDEPLGFSADHRILYVDRAGDVVGVPLNGVDPEVVLYDGNIDETTARFSPDQARLVFLDRDTRTMRLLNLTTGSSLVISDTVPELFFDGLPVSWAPTGLRLAISEGAEVRVLDGNGALERRFVLAPQSYPWPEDLFDGDTAPRVGEPGVAAWARGGTELAVKVSYGDQCSGAVARLVRMDLLSGGEETISWTTSFFSCQSYHVSTWDGSSWVERGALHYDLRYKEKTLDLSAYLPDADGDTKVRIRQRGQEAAHVESLALLAGSRRLQPKRAFRLENGADLLALVAASDGDVADLHEATMEVEWEDVPPGRLQLALKAREETLSNRDARPFRYPTEPDRTYTVLVDGAHPMTVDGAQSNQDHLAEPLFSVRTRPDTGHPAATVVGYAGSDGEFLYSALDFTVDNTRDGLADWASLWVRAGGEWRELRVTEGDSTHGAVAFTRTSAVHHRHKYYEVRVPLAELGARVGDTVELYWQAYGTAAELPEDPFERLPFEGDVLWDPNDRALLWTASGDGLVPEAIFLDEENRRAPLLESFNLVERERFSVPGRRLFFVSADAAYDPDSPCYNQGYEDQFQLRSLLNLTVDLRPRRTSGAGGVLVEGTAADRHFERFTLEWAEAAAPSTWRPVMPPSDLETVDERFTTWVPPGPGSYLLRLTGEDLAGNSLSRVKRISFADSPSITDLYLEPRVFSPNGDGVLDTALVAYRVLEPVHLEFAFENERGDRVRTILRDHSQIGAEFSLLWDGRDDRGLPVPDGEYRLVVQNFEFFVTVDSTPPVLRLAVSDGRLCAANELQALGVLGYAVWDANEVDSALDSGVGANPTSWGPASLGPSSGGVPQGGFEGGPPEAPAISAQGTLGLEELVNRRFRLQAEDAAGNRAQLISPLISERLFFTRFGNPRPTPPLGLIAPPALGCGSSSAFLDLGKSVEAHLAETVRGNLVQMFLEIQPVPIVGGQAAWDQLAPDRWTSRPITEFLAGGGTTAVISEHLMQFPWDKAGLGAGVLTALRMRGVEPGGAQHVSELLAVSSDGVQFRGVSPPAEEVALALVAELDPALGGQLKLWGTEAVAQPFAEATLYLESEEDPRYASPVPIPAATLVEGGFLFTAADWQACKRYEGYFVARTLPAFNPATGRIEVRTFTSNRGDFRFPCLTASMSVGAIPAGECNGPPPIRRRTVRALPRSLDGEALQLLSFFGPDEQGDQTRLNTVNNPVSGQEYNFEVDLEGVPDGIYPIGLTLTNVNGEAFRVGGFVDALSGQTTYASSTELTASLLADSTPPDVALTYPQAGQRVCPVRRGLSMELELEGRVVDSRGVTYILETTVAGAEDWGRNGGSLSFDPEGRPRLPSRILEASTTGVLGTLGGTLGDFEARLRAFNNSGQAVCTEPVPFYFDGLFEGASLLTDLRVFSPNGDGILDEAISLFGTQETATVEVKVWNGIPVPTPKGCKVGPNLHRTLATGLPIFDTAELAWDGRTDGGAVAPDGLYALQATFRDGCGNERIEFSCLSIDTTPPVTEIHFPTATSPLPAIVEVVGTTHDPHFEGWSLDYGAGADPETWAQIESGVQGLHERVLAQWNTVGLEGDFTLRLKATDSLGNQGETRVPLLLSQPVVLITSLEAGPRPFSPNTDARREVLDLRLGLGSPALVDVTVFSLDDQAVEMLADDLALPTGARSFAWDGRAEGGQAFADGVYRLEVYARSSSNVGVTQRESVTALLDATSPLVVLTRPLANQVIPPSGSITGTLADLNLVGYLLTLAEEPSAPAFYQLASGDVSREDASFVALDGLEDGDYLLKAEAEDAGESRTELLVPFIVDSTPPVVVLTAPVIDALVSFRELVGVVGAIEEANLEQWRLFRGTGAEPAAWETLATGTTLPLAEPFFLWNVAGVADGVHTLRLEALDKAGHSREARVRVTVDNTAPTAAITTPASGGFVRQSGDIVGTAADQHLVTYQVALAPGGSQQFSELGSRDVSVTQGTLLTWQALPADGTYTLRLVASDRAGHETTVTSAVTVDTTPPEPPIVLTGELENHRDAHLTWTASPSSDVVGYVVFRSGTRVNPGPVAGTSFVDAGLLEGSFTYTVRALDQAGNESTPSNEVSLRVDLTPPAAEIAAPRDLSRVSGLVDVSGTAWSADDFKEYRLYLEREGVAGRQTLRTSPLPLVAEVLAQWSTLALPEGAAFTLTLEAEDLSGNVATDVAHVTIDNAPPAAPLNLAATVSGTTVHLTWNANTETDLRGYLLYRDGRLVNASGAVIGSLLPYVLTGTTYPDTARPDGTFTYQVYAIDLAENLSSPSNERQATVETRAPRATITTPADGSRFEDELFLQATTPDTDVARVQFQFQPVASSTWTNLGTADTDSPWETTWVPTGPFGSYRLRAVATDHGNRTDAAPPSITVTFTDLTRPPAVLGVAAWVAGGNVTVSWTASTEGDLAGYHVERALAGGEPLRLTTAAITATTYLDAGRADATYLYTVTAVDQTANESDPSAAAEAIVYTPRLVQPFTAVEILTADFDGTGSSGTEVVAELLNSSGTTALAAATSNALGGFSFLAVPLATGDNTLRLFQRDAAGNTSKTVEALVVSDTAPAAPTGLVATAGAGLTANLSWNASPEADVVAYRVLRNGAPAPAATAVTGMTATASSFAGSFSPPANVLDGDPESEWIPAFGDEDFRGEWLQVAWSGRRHVERVELTWRFFPQPEGPPFVLTPGSFDLEAWDGRVWVPLATVRDSGEAQHVLRPVRAYLTDRVRVVVRGQLEMPSLAELAVFHLPLVATPAATDTAANGTHPYRVIAVDTHGLESPPSEEATVAVGDVTPPEPVVLAAVVNGWDVELSWTASVSPDVVTYDLFRDGVKIAAPTGLTSLDAARPNGTFVYQVRAVDGAGNQSPLSNEAPATVFVAPPPAPVALAATAPPEGGVVEMSWAPGGGTPPAGYRLLRATASDGLYAEVTTTGGVSYADRTVENGVTYFYLVVALDAAGNASATSNVASATPLDLVPPAPPVLFDPTVAGRPFATDHSPIAVAGSAEPEALVRLARGGSHVAQARATAAELVEVMPITDFGTLRFSPDGRYAWGGDYYTHKLHDLEAGLTHELPNLIGSMRWTADSKGFVISRFTDRGVVERYDLATAESTLLATLDFVFVAVPSLDGRRLAILGQYQGEQGLWIHDLDTGSWTRVLAVDVFDLDGESLALAPLGDRLAFRRQSPAERIEVVTVATGAVAVIETQPGDAPPQFSPRGDLLLYTTLASGSEQVRTYRFADAVVVSLTSGPAGHSQPAFAADGGAVAYLEAEVGLFLQPLAGGAATRLLDLASGPYAADFVTLAGVSSGTWQLTLDGVFVRLTPAGRFSVPALALEPGLNTVTARATDGAGNTGAASLPVEITLRVAQRPDLAVAASDLTVLPAVPLVGTTAEVSVTVRNGGATVSPTAELTLVVFGPQGHFADLAEGPIVPPIPAGGSHVVRRSLALSGEPGSYTLFATVDPLDALAEASESNNRAQKSFLVGENGRPSLGVVTDKSEYLSGESVAVSAEVVNFGEPFTGRLVVAIEDESGFEVAILATREVVSLPYAGRFPVAISWPTAETFAGSYRAVARLVDAAGAVVDAAEVSFTLLETVQLAARVETDRASYPRGATVLVSGSVEYVAGNTTLTGAEAVVSLFDAGGVRVAEQVRALADLLPGASGTVRFDWPSADAPAGAYTVSFEIRRGGNVAAAAGTLFELFGEQPPALAGSLTLSDATPTLGVPLDVAYQVTAAQELTAVPLALTLRHPATGLELARRDFTVDLTPGMPFAGTASFDTTPFGLGSFVAVLEATHLLDVAPFATYDRTAPTLTLDEPTENQWVTATPTVVATAFDALAAVVRVEIAVDGGAWQNLAPTDSSAGRWALTLAALADGNHSVVARATDAWGNSATTSSRGFRVDATPPVVSIFAVEEGGAYEPGVAPEVEVTDANPVTTQLSLDNLPFTSGTPVVEGGLHVLQVVATDEAGNVTERVVNFTVNTAEAHLALTKRDLLVGDVGGDGAASPGDRLLYQLVVTNDGNREATGAVLRDLLPVEVAVVAGTAQTSQGTVSSESPLVVALGNLAAAATATVSVEVTIDPALPVTVTEITNQATAEAAGLVPVLSDDPDTSALFDATLTPLASPVTPILTVTDATTTEGNVGTRQLSFTLLLSEPTSLPVTVAYTTADGTALAGLDYLPASGTVRFAPGEVSQVLAVVVLGDTVDELAESLQLLLSAPVNAELGDDAAVGTVEDDDPLPTLTLGDATANEGNTSSSAAIFTLRLSHQSAAEVRVAFTTADGTATAPSDYTAAAGTVTVPAGALSALLTVSVLGDTLTEAHETFRVLLTSPDGAVIGDGEGMGTILDDDRLVFCTRGAGYWKTHPQEWPAQQLTLGGVTYNASQLAAFLGYGGPDAATRLARHLVTTKFNRLKGSSNSIDGVVTQADAFLLQYPPGSDPRGAARSQANALKDQLEAYNESGCPRPALSIADAVVTEGDGDGAPPKALLTLTLSSATDRTVTVSYATADGTATALEDYQPASGTLTFGPGKLTTTVEVTVLGDVVVEGDETFLVVLSNAVEATLAGSEATVTIEDDEGCASPNLLANGGAEGQTAAGEIAAWTEVAGNQWQARSGSNPPAAEGSRIFFPGEVAAAELAQTVDLAPFARWIDLGTQRFVFRGLLSTANGDTARLVVEYRDAAGSTVLSSFDSGGRTSVGSWLEVTDQATVPAGTRQARVRLLAERAGTSGAANVFFDALSLVSLDTPVLVVGDALAAEPPSGETGEMSFELRLSCASEEMLTLAVSTVDGTATAPADFEALTDVAVVFAPRQETQQVPVTIHGDVVSEGDEQLFLEAEIPAGITPGAAVLDRLGVGILLEQVGGTFCPRSPGYWKTHPAAWPATKLNLGGVAYNATALAGFLEYGGPDGATKLARQLVATRFNLLSGGDSFMAPVAEAADVFLAFYPPGSRPQGPDRDLGESLKDQLEGYNHLQCDNSASASSGVQP